MAVTNGYALQLQHISKSFPGVKALDDVSFDVKKGTVHSIIGENGAGKSTLMKIINGMEAANNGTILINGEPKEIPSPRAAKNLGIAMIFQELVYVPNLTVGENFFLGKHPKTKSGFIDWKRIYREAQNLLDQEGLKFSPHKVMFEIPISDIQLLEIIKATSEDAAIIIMDEPTSSLTQHETLRLFEKIKHMRDEGRTILYISHKMDEIFELSDYITVMRDGKTIETGPIDQFNRDNIIRMMVGREVTSVYPVVKPPTEELALEVKGLSRGDTFRDINLKLYKGEILGIAGLVGAGRTEIVQAICGLDSRDRGDIFVEGKQVKITDVRSGIRAGITLATEDRRKYGVIMGRSIKENITLPNLYKFSTAGFLRKALERSEARVFFDKMRIKALGLNTEAYTLSGGNQQKLVLAKWMMSAPKILILDEPTRGIDVGAKHEIYELMRDMAESGVAVIMISSELPELIGMSHRIYVIAEGVIAGELRKEEISQINIMNLATGGK
jgi:ABC-type sugar transport system ATPase subunit